MKRHTTMLLMSAAATATAASAAHAGYTLNTLASFNAADGTYPDAGLAVSGNTLYGTTLRGGANNYGTVFSVPVAGGTPTVLTSFAYTNGAYPPGGLLLSGNTLYGTTSYGGGPDGDGAVFSLPLAGGVPTVLGALNGSNGGTLNAGLVLTGGTLYGTATFGGIGYNPNSVSGNGAVFAVPVAGGTPTILTSFNGSNGSSPYGGLVLSGNTLYGTTYGGTATDGTVYSVPLSGGTPTVLATFNGTNGHGPEAGLTLVGNTLYGTTLNGGTYGHGNVFSVPIAGGTPTLLASFNGSNGTQPDSSLTLVGNTLYGRTFGGGGANADGVIFSVPVAGGTPTAVALFDNGNSGNNQTEAGLTLVGNTLYGTTNAGGAAGDGTVFSLNYNHALLSAAVPANFGTQVGTLRVAGSAGSYRPAAATFAATPTGYLAVSGFNPSTDAEVYALAVADSVPANLAADLADAAAEINAGSYVGYTVTASTVDPLPVLNGGGYDFYVTVTGDTLGTGSPYFGFDFTQLNGIGTDTLTVTAAAVVPEPASVAAVAAAAAALLARRQRR